MVEDGQGADGAVGAPARGQRLVSLAQLLHGDHATDHADAGPAVLGRYQRPAEAELAHLLEDIGGKGVGEVPFLGVGCDGLAREVSAELLKLPLLAAQLEVHSSQ